MFIQGNGFVIYQTQELFYSKLYLPACIIPLYINKLGRFFVTLLNFKFFIFGDVEFSVLAKWRPGLGCLLLTGLQLECFRSYNDQGNIISILPQISYLVTISLDFDPTMYTF